jgi:hypothetical protein
MFHPYAIKNKSELGISDRNKNIHGKHLMPEIIIAAV